MAKNTCLSIYIEMLNQEELPKENYFISVEKLLNGTNFCLTFTFPLKLLFSHSGPKWLYFPLEM